MNLERQEFYDGRVKHLPFSFYDIKKTQRLLRISRTLGDQFELCDIILKRFWMKVVGFLSKKIDIEIPVEFFTKSPEDMKLVKSNDLTLVDVQIQLNQYRCLMIECQIENGGENEELGEIFENMRPLVGLEGSFEALFRVLARYMILYCDDLPEFVKEVASVVKVQEMFDDRNKNRYGSLARVVKLKEILVSEIEKYVSEHFLGDHVFRMKELQKRIEDHVGRDITHIQQRITRFFPESFGLPDVYITNSYISCMKALTNFIERKSIDNTEKLAMINWIRKEYTKMFIPYSEFVKTSDFRSLVDTLERDFIDSTSEILATWSNNIVDNLFRNELKPIQVRDGDPIYTSGPKELFDIVTEYTQPVVDYDLRDLLVRVLLTVKSMILVYIQNVRDKFIEKKNNGITSEEDLGIVSFIPFVNDFSNISDYCKCKKKELMEIGMVKNEKHYLWMEKDIPAIVGKMSDQCMKVFVRLVRMDLNVRLRKLFGMDWENGRPVMASVLKRMESYVDDLKFLESRYRKEINLDEYVVKEYIRRLYVSSRKFNKEDVQRVKNDVRLLRSVVKRKYYKAVDFIQRLMVEDREGHFISFLSKTVLRMYPDFPKSLAEELIRKTGDIRKSRSDLKKMLDIPYMKCKEVGADVSIRTFMSSINFDN